MWSESSPCRQKHSNHAMTVKTKGVEELMQTHACKLGLCKTIICAFVVTVLFHITGVCCHYVKLTIVTFQEAMMLFGCRWKWWHRDVCTGHQKGSNETKPHVLCGFSSYIWTMNICLFITYYLLFWKLSEKKKIMTTSVCSYLLRDITLSRWVLLLLFSINIIETAGRRVLRRVLIGWEHAALFRMSDRNWKLTPFYSLASLLIALRSLPPLVAPSAPRRLGRSQQAAAAAAVAAVRSGSPALLPEEGGGVQGVHRSRDSRG